MKIYVKHYSSADRTFTFAESENGRYYCTSHVTTLEDGVTEQQLIDAGYKEFHVELSGNSQDSLSLFT